MDIVHIMWLFMALFPSLIQVSFSIGCRELALPNSNITVSSNLSVTYGKENIRGLSDKPWVGGGTTFASNWVSLDFPNKIELTDMTMAGGRVELYGNVTLVECYVRRFVLEYKNETGSWKKCVKFKSETGYRNTAIDTSCINGPITSLKITIYKYVGCPAVNLKLMACDHVDECKKYLGRVCPNATCENTPASYKCNCFSGYKGDPCKDIDECSLGSGYCDDTSRASCRNNVGSYSCSCNKGYSGDGKTCTDIDECSLGSRYCDDTSRASCSNNVGSYLCSCNKGYSGDGKTCTDIDECSLGSRYCDDTSRASCINTEGSYSCTCNEGYSDDGKSCTDIDECSLGSRYCDDTSRASCINTEGSYSCTCNEGYSGDGKSCTDINECDRKKCHQYANCSNTIGSFTCTCQEGYEGDGKYCKGDNVTIIKNNPSGDMIRKRFGQRLELFCQADGLPTPIIVWSTPKGISNFNVTVSEASKGNVARTLVVEKVTMDNDGFYKCVANNNDTNDQWKIDVSIIGTPTNPNITPKEVRERYIRVVWNKPSDEGASSVTGYVLHYSTNGSEPKSVRPTRELTATVTGLKPNTKYYLYVDAMNKEGASTRYEDPARIYVLTLAPKPGTYSKPKQDHSSTTLSSVKIQIVKIQVVKLDAEYDTMLQVIVQEVVSRRKRDASNFPKNIGGYDAETNCKEDLKKCYYIAAELENKDTDFVVGDGEMYGKYKNVKLQPGTTYNIYVRGISYNDEKEFNVGEPSPALKISTADGAERKGGVDGGVVGIAVGLTVLFVVLVVLVLLAVIYIRSRRPKTIEIDPETGEKKERKKNLSSELLPLTRKAHGKRKSGQVEDGSPDPNHPPVPTSGFAKYVGKLHKSDDRGFMIQYNTLDTSQTYTSEFATSPENKDKNRYANIVAYDVSRVELKQIDDDDSSSYINASLTDGYNSANAYIATQGPLPGTFNDFWRMVWEKNCPSVVMLTNLQERHKLKCHKYWPEESETYGDITVTATRREQYADYVIRTFLLKMNETEEEREIKQFHFTVWPDHGVPEYPTAILAFQRRVRAHSTRDSGPLVVHCSAGVGRSGTFIVIDCMLARIQNEQTIDIYNYVRYLRTRRMFMVQTEEQYVFCHDALLESILCGNTQMAAHNLRIEMNRLRQGDATTKMTGFESEFKVLNKVSPSLPKESFVVATYPQNVPKNRYHDILASDHGRVILGDDDDDNEDGPYINAVYVDGYKQQNAFILTQAPMKATIKDFWRMLYEKHSACVLLLTTLTEEEGEFPQFWPDEGSEEYDKFTVALVSDASKGETGSEDQFQQEKLSSDLVERKLKITKEEDKSLVVKMFQHLSWKETSVPSDISAIISLIQRIEKWQQHSGNGPITVVCNDGQGRSGTFAALCSVLERVKTEQVVDVFQTIKAMRIQRPGLVKHVDQYQFIHFGVQEYLDSFADYANFK